MFLFELSFHWLFLGSGGLRSVRGLLALWSRLLCGLFLGAGVSLRLFGVFVLFGLFAALLMLTGSLSTLRGT